MKKTSLITRCSSGVGQHFAQSIAARGDQLVATARNPEAQRFPDTVRVYALYVTRTEPPLPLPLGLVAYGIADRKLAAFSADIHSWRHVAISNNFD